MSIIFSFSILKKNNIYIFSIVVVWKNYSSFAVLTIGKKRGTVTFLS
jgi:hypothetical protein